MVEPKLGIAGDRDHANFFRTHGCDVELTAFAPVDLHKIRPGRYSVVTAKTESAAVVPAGIQTGPLAHSRMTSIGAHDPAGFHEPAISFDAMLTNSPNSYSPSQLHSGLNSVIHHQPVQLQAAHPKAVAIGKARLHRWSI